MYTPRYLLFLGFVLTTFACFAQTPPTTTTAAVASDNSGAIVNYSFSTNKMDVLPFDKPFVFHLTDLPSTNPAFTSVKISVIQLPSKNPTPNQHNEIRQDDNNNNRTFILTEWKRPAGAASFTSIDIPFVFRLPPNKGYQVHIELSTDSNLTPDQKDTLENLIRTAKKLNQTVNNLAKKKLDSIKVGNSSFIGMYDAELMGDLRQVVKTVNPAYELKPTDLRPLRQYIADFTDALVNFNSKRKKITADGADPVKLAVLNKDIFATDWYTVDKTTKLKTDVDTVINNFLHIDADVATHKATAISLQTNLANVISTRDELINKLISSVIKPNVFIYNPLSETYNPDFVTNSKFYINLDVGYAYVWRMDRALAYSGFNIYFRPIDKTIPLSSYSGWQTIATRTSLLIGISLGSVEKENVRKGLIGTQALVMGGGFKINPFLKINGGCFMNYRYDPNPLVTQSTYHFSMSPFVSLSLDLDVKPLFTGLSDAIFK